MIRRIRLTLVLLVAIVLQTTVVPHLRVFDAVPDLTLLAVLAVAYEDGRDSGLVFGFVAGLVSDMFLSTPVGLSALAYGLTGYAVGTFQEGMLRTTRRAAPVLGGVGGLIGGLTFLAVGALVGEPAFLTTDSVRIVAIAAVYGALVATVVIPVVQWTARRPVDAGSWSVSRR